MILPILTKEEKQIRFFDQNTICNALMMYSVSPKLYRFLRDNSLTYFTLPSKSTLGNRISHIKCPPGIQQDFLLFVKHKLSSANFWERQSILMFDEIDVKDTYEYCKRLKQVFGSKKKAQVVLLRGDILNRYNL